MKKRNKGILIGLSIAMIAALLHQLLPIMKCYDGCECGYQRIWYVMPDSPWSHKQFFLRVENSGDTNHQHQIWDGTWGVWCKLPWQK
jgi:hypothetical protein